MPNVSPAAQRFLDALTDQRSVEILELIAMYERMPSDAKLFLERADPKTLKWLTHARPDEIAQLEEGIGLVRATRTVGRFGKWALIGIFGMFFAMVSLGEHIIRFLALFRGVK
jgi:hypothetical protein